MREPHPHEPLETRYGIEQEFYRLEQDFLSLNVRAHLRACDSLELMASAAGYKLVPIREAAE